MYKVLIVDDEALERSALESILRNTYGSRMHFRQAENGKIAVECARSFEPHIVLMDIKMPGMNGIEAARCIKEANEDVQIIMLTGFTYFHYAKECIRVGVMDFIVKPALDEVVLSTVEKAVQLISAKEQTQVYTQTEKDKLKLADKYLENELLVELFFGAVTSEKKQEIVTMLGLANSWYTVAIVLKDKQSHQVSHFITHTNIRIFECCYYGRYYLLLCSEVQESEVTIEELMKSIGKQIGGDSSKQVRIGISLSTNKSEKIPELVQQAYLAYQQKEGIQFYTSAYVQKMAEQQLLEENLLGLFKERQYTELMNQLYPTMTALFIYDTSPKEQLCDILFAINRSVSKSIKVESTFTLYQKLSQLEDVEAIKHFVFYYIQELVDRMITQEVSYQDEWSSRVKKILNDKYTQEITLEQVAKSVGFSTYYFSRLFKQTFGESFIDYITHLRVEKAKSLLRNPRTLVKTVCYEVGYNEPNYFTRVFKKETGLTPSEYQKNAMNTNKY